MTTHVILNRTSSLQPSLIKCFSAIACLFVLEVILGFNGRLLLLSDIPIRMVLYALFSVILLAMLVDAAATNKLSITKDGLKRLIKPLDLSIAAFLFLNAIWIFIVPSITGYGIAMAVEQTVAFSVLALYFPIIILVRIGYMNWTKSHRMIKWSLLGLALLHIFLYIGEMIDGNQEFAVSLFDLIQKITMGHSTSPFVMYAEMKIKHNVRIIYPNSIFLVGMFYYFITSKQNWKNTIFFLIGFTALLTTLTKSLWLGFASGMLIIIVFCLFDRKRLLAYGKTILVHIALALITSLVLNSVVFDNYVLARTSSFFAVQEGDQRVIDPVTRANLHPTYDFKRADELDVTQRANKVRLIQFQMLIEKWKESPWYGFGYGSYADNYLRNNEKPYLYEMLLPSFLVQVGLIGLLVWAAFFSYIAYLLLRKTSNRKNAAAILYILIGLFVAAQFNPFLFGTSSMCLLLFCFIQMQAAKERTTAD